MSSNPCIYMDTRWRPLKWQTMATYDCTDAGQSPESADFSVYDTRRLWGGICGLWRYKWMLHYF